MLGNSPSTLNLADSLWRVSREVDKPVVEAIDYILAKAKAHGVVAGIHNGELAWFHEGRLRPYISATLSAGAGRRRAQRRDEP
jgi:hypothetical protein